MSLLEAAPRQLVPEAGGLVHGAAIAIVTQNKDPDKLCRVKVRFPWHDKPRESYWARLATPMAGKDRGLVLIPEVSDEVVCIFERDKIEFPVVVGSLYNGPDGPPYDNADGNNEQRLFKSRSGHTLLFKDTSSGGVVEARHKSGKHMQMDDDGMVFEDDKGNKVKIDSNGGSINVEATGQLTVKAATITLQSSGTMEIKAGGTLTIRGSLVNIN